MRKIPYGLLFVSFFYFLLFGVESIFAYSTHSVQIDRFFETSRSVENDPIRVTVRFTNLEVNDLRGFYYTEYLPEGLNVSTVAVRIDGTAISDYLFEQGAGGSVYPGYYPVRWILETPTQFYQNNPISRDSVLEIVYALTAEQDGVYELEEFSWAGYYPDGSDGQRAAFGHSEQGDSVSLNFEYISTKVLTLQASGNGTTTPSVGSHDYPVGTVVNLSAIASSGWSFVSWSGEVANENVSSTTVVMDANKTVTADFAIDAEIIDNDGDGLTEAQGDCNDNNASVYPGAAENCGDGIDQDCSGADLTCPEDIDNDGDGLTEAQGDCNDNNASVYPGAAENCGDGIDQDCSGADLTCPEDIDNDGDGLTEAQGDCNDNNASVYPGAAEICGDGIDQDCSGADLTCPEDEGLVREAEEGTLVGTFEIGNDPASSGGQYVYVPNGVGTRMDGPDETHKITYTFNLLEGGTYRIKGMVYAPNWGDDTFWVRVNDSPAGGYLWDVFQNTSYQQDYVNDRNGADPVEVSLLAGMNTVTVYLREDGTRLDSIELEPVTVTPPVSDHDGDGITEAQGDCNDNSASVYPGADEICGDGIDQDCNGLDVTCSEDIDDDADGYTENDGDCNDSNGSVYPGALEICSDGIDQDCSGSDLICPENIDNDGDGYTENMGDCVDSDLDIYPGAEEICGDNIDQDCNGVDLICDNVVNEPDPGEQPSVLPLEFGEIEVDNQWRTVTLNRSFSEPVVIAGAVGYTDQDPAVIRVRNVTGSGFEVRVQEWDYLDGEHALEQVNYIVIESGLYELPNGTRVEVARFTATAVNSFASIQFNQSYGTVPVVMTAISSVNESDAVVMRLRNITTTGFDYRIQEQESNDKLHASEMAGYIAWEPSAGSIDGLVFEIGRTSNSVTHTFQALPFYEPFSSPPVFLAGMQTTDGGDTAAARWQKKQATGIEVKVEEEQSRDVETNHTTEVVGYMAFEAQNPTQDDTNPAYDLVQEAEDGVLYGAFDFGSDPAASGELYVHVPNGIGTRFNGPDESHKIIFTFEIPEDGMYRIKGAVHAANGSDDSFWVKVNGSPAGGYLWDVLQNTGYQQDFVNDRDGADPVEVWLEADENNSVTTVTVYLREDGTRLDRIELEPADR